MGKKSGISTVLCVLLLLLLIPALCPAYSRPEVNRFQHRIIDYRHRLNPAFRKKVRPRTDLIIVHTSELGLGATLRVVSGGKRLKKGRYTPGGHANYVIARNGKTYRILDRRYRADHAGLSMWNGVNNVSSISLGIELVGYHYAPLTRDQYRSLGLLLQILKQAYRLDDRDVLTHSQVAYGRPNPWFRKNHRGRKRCAKNFDRVKAGLKRAWAFDPDVRAGRLTPDPILAGVFYKFSGQVTAALSVPAVPAKVQGSNIISKKNSAWSIAGDEYKDETTAYILPDGRALPGNRVAESIGWSRLPPGTRVLLNQETGQVNQAANPVKKISGRMTAWSHAGQDYRSDTTIYFLPSGRISLGSAILDWDDLPPGTRLMVGYKGPYDITTNQTAYKIAGRKYKDKSVVYHYPGGRLVTGNLIRDFSDLPSGVTLYLPKSK